APTEPADGRESGAGGGFVLDSGKVGRAVLLCSLDEWPGHFGTDVLGCVLSSVDYGVGLLIFGTVGVSLGVEARGFLLPPVCLLLGALGYLVEASEFFGDELDRAIGDEAAYGFCCLGCDVGEASVCRVAFQCLDGLCSGIGHVFGDDMQPVGLAASGHPDVDPG